jgi:hypothetical protein
MVEGTREKGGLEDNDGKATEDPEKTIENDQKFKKIKID